MILLACSENLQALEELDLQNVGWLAGRLFCDKLVLWREGVGVGERGLNGTKMVGGSEAGLIVYPGVMRWAEIVSTMGM